jgi:hypothetical protein
MSLANFDNHTMSSKLNLGRYLVIHNLTLEAPFNYFDMCKLD